MFYILRGRTPVPEDDTLKWARWFEDHDEERIVARDLVGDTLVSTVFLGVDHAHAGGPPVLFETMVFSGDSLENAMWRYRTYDEAEAGHAAVLEEARRAAHRVDLSDLNETDGP